MTPTRKQFKEFIDAIQMAQVKEENLDKAFNIMFGLEDHEIAGNELSWWLEEAPKNDAKFWIDEKEYNVSDIDVFYDYLVENLNKDINEKNEEKTKKSNSCL